MINTPWPYSEYKPSTALECHQLEDVFYRKKVSCLTGNKVEKINVASMLQIFS